MRVETFNYLWEQGIAKAAQSVIDEISADALKTYNVKLDVSKEMCERVYSKYEELRLQVRKKYFRLIRIAQQLCFIIPMIITI